MHATQISNEIMHSNVMLGKEGRQYIKGETQSDSDVIVKEICYENKVFFIKEITLIIRYLHGKGHNALTLPG